MAEDANQTLARSPGPVWVVAGAPGAGKSTVADLLVTRLDPAPALLDKDVLFAGFVAQVQALCDRAVGEREGPWYDELVKVHEYGGMTATARQVRRGGCGVVLVAPFTDMIRDPARWALWVPELGGDPVHLLWVRTDPVVLRERLVRRGSALDAGKLADFPAFVRRMRPDEPPPVPHLQVDNRAGAPALSEQVDGLIGLTCEASAEGNPSTGRCRMT
jgi:hypothetical protein